MGQSDVMGQSDTGETVTGQTGMIEATGPTPEAPGRRWRRRVVTVAVGLGAAAGVAVGATALAGAATSPSTTAPAGSTTPGSSGGPGGAGGHFHGGFGRFGGFGGIGGFGGGPGGAVVHGEYTVKGPNGYETIAERTGTVSTVTDTSGSTWTLTVKSADGTSGTFTVNSSSSVNGGESGISSVKTGDTVTVTATVSGSSSTATQITDQTTLQANGKSWMPVRPGGPAGGPSAT
jgi:hypothetical protein